MSTHLFSLGKSQPPKCLIGWESFDSDGHYWKQMKNVELALWPQREEEWLQIGAVLPCCPGSSTSFWTKCCSVHRTLFCMSMGVMWELPPNCALLWTWGIQRGITRALLEQRSPCPWGHLQRSPMEVSCHYLSESAFVHSSVFFQSYRWIVSLPGSFSLPWEVEWREVEIKTPCNTVPFALQ